MDIRPQSSHDVDNPHLQLARQCWDRDPHARPTMDEVNVRLTKRRKNVRRNLARSASPLPRKRSMRM